MASDADAYERGVKAKFSVQQEISNAEQMVYDGNDEAGVALSGLLQKMKRGLITGEDAKRLQEVIKEAKAYGMFSRPGVKAKFKVEDRFYFGKGRKER